MKRALPVATALTAAAIALPAGAAARKLSGSVSDPLNISLTNDAEEGDLRVRLRPA